MKKLIISCLILFFCSLLQLHAQYIIFKTGRELNVVFESFQADRIECSTIEKPEEKYFVSLTQLKEIGGFSKKKAKKLHLIDKKYTKLCKACMEGYLQDSISFENYKVIRRAYNQKLNACPIYKDSLPQKGIYYSYKELYMNRPSDTTTEFQLVEKDKSMTLLYNFEYIIYKLKDSTNKNINGERIYAISDGKDLFLKEKITFGYRFTKARVMGRFIHTKRAVIQGSYGGGVYHGSTYRLFDMVLDLADDAQNMNNGLILESASKTSDLVKDDLLVDYELSLLNIFSSKDFYPYLERYCQKLKTEN